MIAELLDEDLPAYTTSLDATLPGENVLLSAYSNKRKLWVAVHRTQDGKQISAWAATECLARRLAGLQAHISAPKQPTPEAPPETPSGPLILRAQSKDEDEAKTDSEEEWQILF